MTEKKMLQMDAEPTLTLTHTFSFRDKRATYTISFFPDSFDIESQAGEHSRIAYTDIHKIKSKNQTLRIYLKDGTRIYVPCTIGEIRSVQSLFRRSYKFQPSAVQSVAFVEFGELRFFLKIHSNEYGLFKSAIIKRIAKYFYPAFDDDGISLGLFKQFIIKVKKDGMLVRIENSDELDTALIYFDYKVDIVIEYSKECTS